MTTPLLDALLALTPPANARILDDSVVVRAALALLGVGPLDALGVPGA